jgi:hypothetical protein
MQPEVAGILFDGILAYVVSAFVLGTTSGALLRVTAQRLWRGLVLDIEAPSLAHAGQELSIDVSIRNHSFRQPKKRRQLAVVLESPSLNPRKAVRALEQTSSGWTVSFVVSAPQVSEATLLTTKVKLIASSGVIASHTKIISVVPSQQT